MFSFLFSLLSPEVGPQTTAGRKTEETGEGGISFGGEGGAGTQNLSGPKS